MRVLEISNSEGAAAFAGKLFQRWGAEVIRIESDERIDPTPHSDMYVNGGKSRVAIDFGDPKNLEELSAIAETSDIIISDLSPAQIDDFSLLEMGGARTCARIFITPFGRSGPYKDFKATPATLNALGGSTWLSGDAEREPLTLPGQYCYYQAGSIAYVNAMSQWLYGKSLTTIDVSVIETLASLHQFTDVMWIFEKSVRSRHGNRFQTLCPTTLLPASDGWVGMNILPNFWAPFALWIGGSELADRKDIFLNSDRMSREDEIEDLITEFLRDKKVRDILKDGQETWRVPIGITVPLDEIFDDEQLVSRKYFKEIKSDRRSFLTPGSPYTISGLVPRPEQAPERVGSLQIKDIETNSDALPRAGNNSADRPLAGLKIADMTRIWSGPLCSRLLGDLGADVLKIEAPMGRGPRLAPGMFSGLREGDSFEQPWNRHGLNNKLNRNKRSVSFDLKSEAGRDIFLKIVAESDVLIENFSVRAMPSLGLDYDTLHEVNPRLIYVAMPALGREGPYKDYVGLGPSIEPLSGLPEIMGYSPGEPRVTSQAITDAAAGITAATSVLAALKHRRETGEGSLVDLSQSEAMGCYVGEFYLQTQIEGSPPGQHGNDNLDYAFQGIFRCRALQTNEFNSQKASSERSSDQPVATNRDDEWIAISCQTEDEWRIFAEFAGESWHVDPLFSDTAVRRINRQILVEKIDKWTRKFDKTELMISLQDAGVPAGAVLSAPEYLQDPHLVEEEYFSYTEWSTGEKPQSDGLPVKYDGTRRYSWWSGPPALGGANEEVLEKLGYSESEISELYSQGVIVNQPPE
ncbi:MAG: CoA transferase [Chloroflexota bacterium]|nr:CoA transferase [Chloroflexota bacterium]